MEPRRIYRSLEASARARRFDPLGTTALTLGTGALGAMVVFMAMWSNRAD
jgi:hypothetical protein